MMGAWKKGLAVLLAVSVCLGVVPVDVFAGTGLQSAAVAGAQGQEETVAEGLPGQNVADGLSVQEAEAGDGAFDSDVGINVGNGVSGSDAGTEVGNGVSDATAGTKAGNEVSDTDAGTEVGNGVSDTTAGTKAGNEVSDTDAGTKAENGVSDTDAGMEVGNGAAVPGAVDGDEEAFDAAVSAQAGLLRDSGATGSPIEESFIAMTEGQTLEQAVKEKQYYIFAPTESGWYRLALESKKRGDLLSAGVYQTIYYEGDEQKKKTYKENLYLVSNTAGGEHVMWLNQNEKYVFHCSVTRYADSSDTGAFLTMKKAGTFRLETEQPPTATSDFGFVGTGMKVAFRYEDGTSYTESVRCTVTDNGELSRYITNELEAPRWSDIAVQKGESISSQISVRRVDGNEQADFSALSDGSHTATLGVGWNRAGSSSYMEFDTGFEVSHNPIETISVVSCKDTYQQNMAQYLGDITIKAVRKNGKEELYSSATSYIYQSLPYDEEEEPDYPGGPGMQYGMTSIDSYLENGGSLGEATVTVQFQGKETTYSIQIEEYPYDKMEVFPLKTVYYTDSGYEDSNYRLNYSSDFINVNDLNRITMSRKDGGEDLYYVMSSQFNLPYAYKLKFGIEHEGKLYTDIDQYIRDGGTYGEHKVTVTYMDFEVSYTVEVRKNPYVRMEISKMPDEVSYPYNTTRFRYSGLTIRAYKNDTEYDTYTYAQNAPAGAAVDSWLSYFRCYPKDEENPYGYKVGSHTVTITFFNMRTTFQVTVREREPDPPRPEEPVYVDMKLLKKPSRTLYYVKENEHLSNCLSAAGLEISLTDSKGETKKYKYNYDDPSNEEYGLWSDVSRYIKYEWKRIDWSAPGTYTVSVFCQENCVEFDVTVADSPVDSFEVLRMPDTLSHYFYENKTITSSNLLRGMAYRITFDDGSMHAVTLRNNYSSDAFEVSFQGRTYTIGRAWLRSTSNGTASVGENAVVFTLFGKQYQSGPITILDSPVESLEVVKNPNDLVCIGQNAKPDLYGAKFKITYTGGRTREVEVREHVSSVPVEEDGGTVTAQFMTEWQAGDLPSEGFFHRYIQLDYFNQKVRIAADIKPQDLEATVILNNGQAAAVLDEEHPYQVYSFTPETEGTYSFFCVERDYQYTNNHNFYVSFFDGDQYLMEYNIGGWDYPMQQMQTLKPGHTYYYIVCRTEKEDNTRIAYQCYVSSEITNKQQLGAPTVDVVDTEKKIWYEYEIENASLWPNMRGTTLKCTYTNGWTEEKYIYNDMMSSVTIDGKYYGVEWKYVDPDEPWSQRPQLREDNALVYTRHAMAGGTEPDDRVIKEIPIRLNVPNPIESLSIDVNPYEGLCEYQLAPGNPAGLVVTAHFKDEGRADETFVWDGSDPLIDGCRLMFDGINRTPQTGEHGGRIYKLKVTCMDVFEEISFEVMPNPVTGFELVTQPQKRTYYPFEQSSALDLFGMEYDIVYRDGTKERVSVTEHSSYAPQPEGSDAELDSFHKTAEREDGKTVTELYFSYQGCEQKLTEFEELPFPADQAAELLADRANDALLGHDGSYRIFRFTSQEANHYKINVSGNLNFEILRYGEDGGLAATEDASRSGQNRYRASMEWDMGEADTVYFVFRSREGSLIGSLRATLSGEALEKEDLAQIDLTVNAPAAGEALPDTGQASTDGYRIAASQWYGDADEDGLADFATAHRLMLILAPQPRYRFTNETKVTLNGAEIEDLVLGSDGRLTLYYTFPHTECKIELPEVNGYTLDTAWNAKADRVAYGEAYRFRYLNAQGSPDETLSVKANGNVVELDGEGYYTLSAVKENILVTVRSDIGDIEPGEDESKVTMHNRSAERFDVMLGKKGQTIADNPEGENTLPLLPSYENGSEDFFYGWYLGKDVEWNGKGTRFTSRTNLAETFYELYAKWGSGIFEQRQGKRNAVYRVLSFDEYNQMKVEITGIRRYELYASARGGQSVSAAKAAAFGMQADIGAPGSGAGKEYTQEDARDADETEEDIRLTVPGSLEQEDMQLQEGLELTVESCTVVAVAKGAFADEEGLTSVVLPETVEQIGTGAFENCKDLEEIELPDGITKIGDRAFAGCDSLKKIVLPATLTDAGDELFADCDNISVVLPDAMEEINSGAFAGAKDLTVICSSKLKESGLLDDIQNAGVTLQTIDLAFDYENGEKTFSYGADEESLAVQVLVNKEAAEESRPLTWQYEETDAFAYRTEGNELFVTPKRVTTEEDDIQVVAIDAETGAQASLALHTVPADLSQTNGDGEAAFEVRVSGSFVYNGEEQRPEVMVYRRTGGTSRLDASEYDVAYSDNVNAGAGKVTVTGKGNYTGSMVREFEIGKAEQAVIAFDLEKTTDNLIFPLNAKASGNGKLNYSSVNPAVAMVDGHGIVIIRGAGTAEIRIWASETANYKESAIKTITLTVKQAGIVPPSSDKDPNPNQPGQNPINPNPPIQNNPNGSGSSQAGLQLTADSYTKALGSKPFTIKASADTAISFVSGNPKVASVNASGKVTLKKCGKAMITVTAGEERAAVAIRVTPKKAKAKAVSKKAGEIKVSWNRHKEAKGYVIEYSADKKWKKNVSKKVVSKNKTTGITLKKLKSGKAYYVRVKAYTLIDGKMVYGAESKAIRVKVKK